jgi:hypothetical protein
MANEAVIIKIALKNIVHKMALAKKPWIDLFSSSFF